MSEELTIRATFDTAGVPIAFFPSDFWPNGYPETAVEITSAQYEELMSHQGLSRFVDGLVIVDSPEVGPTIADYENAIQNLVDNTAREKQFRDGVTLASYIGSTIPRWAAEAMAFVAWRDNVWRYSYGELAKFQAGQRPQPTVEKFLDEIARIAWPVA